MLNQINNFQQMFIQFKKGLILSFLKQPAMKLPKSAS